MAADPSKRIVFLCSGGGGNLAFVHNAIQHGWLRNAEIVGVLTDRQCPANEFCEKVGLYNKALEFAGHDQSNLLSELDVLRPNIIITTVHKIIRSEVLERYEGKLINLHYSLLPAFAGLIGTASIKAALDHQVLFGGVTVHRVNELVDAGRPIVQCAIALNESETLESIMPVIFRCGCIALLKALNLETEKAEFESTATQITVLGHACLFNGGTSIMQTLGNNEKFWDQLREKLR